MKLRKIPRGTFWIGGLSAVGLAVPLLSVGIHGLVQRLGWGPRVAPMDESFWISLIFAGVPALLSGGGVARKVAHRMAEQETMTLGGAVVQGAIAMAVAGVGLAILAAVPLGVLPDDPRRWAPLAGVGLSVGALTGLALTILIALRALRQRRHRQSAPPAEAA